MILAMSRLRILGPRARLPEVLQRLQEFAVVHLDAPPERETLVPLTTSAGESRLRLRVTRLLEDATAAQRLLAVASAGNAAPQDRPLPAIARQVSRARREAERAIARIQALEEEQALLARYAAVFDAFEPLLRSEQRWASGRAYHVVLRAGQRDTVARLRAGLTAILGEAFEIRDHPLPGDETALLILVPQTAAPRVEQWLAAGRVSEVSLPAGFAGQSLAQAMPAMMGRRRELPRELSAGKQALAEAGRRHGPMLRAATRQLSDLLVRLHARDLARVTAHAFVLEGWLPTDGLTDLRAAMARAFGSEVVLEVVGQDCWTAETAPVVLHNPRLFRPFELLVGLLPLPRYGSIDPTPFVAVFFPMFFGLILGDIGYAVMLLFAGWALRRRSTAGGWKRSLAEIMIACALFSGIFGLLFGELFGDLGRRWFGWQPIWFDREQALVPFLVLAVSLGAVHMLLGLIIGAVSSFHGHRRQSIGRGLAAVMLVLVVLALLASVEVLPRPLLTPVTVAILVLFPVMVVVEGIVAPIEFLSTLGRVLSYARIMALGTASVMLAVVANEMAGAFGSALIGVTFALLFHMVNFALGVASPAIHALRLHYVEFFGNFYSPGGVVYRPFGHGTPPPSRAA